MTENPGENILRFIDEIPVEFSREILFRLDAYSSELPETKGLLYSVL